MDMGCRSIGLGTRCRQAAQRVCLSTKVGRWLRPERAERIERGSFAGGLNFQPVYDYSYDGTMRALEQSYSGSA